MSNTPGGPRQGTSLGDARGNQPTFVIHLSAPNGRDPLGSRSPPRNSRACFGSGGLHIRETTGLETLLNCSTSFRQNNESLGRDPKTYTAVHRKARDGSHGVWVSPVMSSNFSESRHKNPLRGTKKCRPRVRCPAEGNPHLSYCAEMFLEHRGRFEIPRAAAS